MNIDRTKSLKTKLELNNLAEIDRDLLRNVEFTNINCCCSNNSYYFIYLEQLSIVLTININKLSKFDLNLSECYQILNLTAPPVGNFKRLSINKSGTHILLIYNENISAIELPIKWGKYDDYEGGRKKIMCRTIQFNLKNPIEVIDGLWHNLSDSDVIVTLVKYSNNTLIKYFSIENPNVVIKSLILNNLNESLVEINEKQIETFISMQIGYRFEYNGRNVYPIFLLKANGQIVCVVEFEENQKFINLGALSMDPYCMDFDTYQAKDFLCLNGEPNCIVLLLNNGVIHHCLFMPFIQAGLTNASNFESTEVFVDDHQGESEAVLFVYETTQIDNENGKYQVNLLKDPFDEFHYLLYHETGVHCAYLPWLENARLSFLRNEFESSDFIETKLSVFSHLICTRPVESSDESPLITGLAIMNELGSRELVIALTDRFDLICAFINKTSQIDFDKFGDLKETLQDDANKDKFLNHIKTILKKNFTLPTIKSDITNSSIKDYDAFCSDVINSLKSEYLEKQRLAFNEIIKRSKLLKQQEQTEREKLKEIKDNISKLKENKTKLDEKYGLLDEKQNDIAKRLDRISISLNEKLPKFTDNELKMKNELITIKKDMKRLEQQVIDKKQLINLSELPSEMEKSLSLKKSEFTDEELSNVKTLLKDESNKIKDLIQKVNKLKLAVKI